MKKSRKFTLEDMQWILRTLEAEFHGTRDLVRKYNLEKDINRAKHIVANLKELYG